MAKLVILLAILLTLQESYQTPIRPRKHNGIEVIEQFATAMRYVDEINEFIGGELSSVVRNYEHEIDETIDNENIASIVQNLMDSIQKVESNSSDDSRSCIDAALRNEMIANNELKKGVDSCISAARAVGAEIQGRLESIDGKTIQIKTQIISGFHKCMSLENETELVNCLTNVIDPINHELLDIDQQVHEIVKYIQKQFEDGIRNLNICFQSAEHDFNLKGETIMEDLNSCVQTIGNSFKNYTPKSVMDIIRELKEKIEDILHTLSHLPTSIEDIPNKISELIAHINISSLISHLKEEVNEAINDGGSNAESCRPTADKRIDDLSKSSEEAANKCIAEANEEVDNIQSEIAKLADEANKILEDIKNKTYDCFVENKLNPLEFYKCLEQHVDELQQIVSELQKKVTETYENAKEQGDEIIKSMATCVNKVQFETIDAGQVLIDDVETCVLQSYFKYYMK